MPSLNRVILSGTITGAPKEKQVGDTHVVELNLVYEVKAKDGTKDNYVDVDCWGDLGSEVAAFPEGTEIIVDGTLNRRAWKDKDDNWQSKHSIRANNVQSLGHGQSPVKPVEPAGDPIPF